MIPKFRAWDEIQEHMFYENDLSINFYQVEGEPDSEVLSGIRYEVLKVEDENND